MTATDADEIMSQEIHTVSSSETVRDAHRRMEASEVRSLLVVDDNRPVGVIKRNAIQSLSVEELERPVSSYMLTDVPVIQKDQSLDAASDYAIHEINVQQYAVVNESGEFVGAIDRDHLTARSTGGATGGRLSDGTAGEDALVREGMKVKDASGSSLGTLKDASFRVDGTVESMLVEHGLIFKHEKQLPGDLIASLEGDDIHLKISSTEFGMMRDLDDQV